MNIAYLQGTPSSRESKISPAFSGRKRFAALSASLQAHHLSGEFRSGAAGGKARTQLVVVPTASAAEDLLGDLRFFLTPNHEALIGSFPAWEVLPFDLLSPTTEISFSRMCTLHRLSLGQPQLLVASVDALLQRLPAPETLRDSVFTMRVGEELERDTLVERLMSGGYRRSSIVEEAGQFAVRGVVIDFLPPASTLPVRVELYVDRVEAIRVFDAGSQRTTASIQSIEVLPARELFLEVTVEEAIRVLRGRASELTLPQAVIKPVEEAIRAGTPWPGIEQLQPLFLKKLCTIWDYLGDGVDVTVCDEYEVLKRAEGFQQLLHERETKARADARLFPDPQAAYLSFDNFKTELEIRTQRYFDSFTISSANTAVVDEDVTDETFPAATPKLDKGLHIHGQLKVQLERSRHTEDPLLPLAEEIRSRKRQGYRVAISVLHTARLRRIEELLGRYEIQTEVFEGGFGAWATTPTVAQAVSLLTGSLSKGFRDADRKLLIFSDQELFPDTRLRHQSSSANRVRKFIGSVSQLKEDDYVVHLDYGIGIYRGLRPVTVDDQVSDFLLLEYAAEAKLFVPVDQIGKVQKYSGSEGKRPLLTRLGAKQWDVAKRKVQENVAQLAGQLLQVMAKRELVTGTSFGAFDTDDAQFADTFPYEETPDQQQAIEAVLRDMSKEQPMDRLVCGDVGYGKTEVAIRAAFKAANFGKQTALLVPTTILAEQHFKTFKARFSETPITVGCLSRFFSAAENKATLQAVARGEIDIVIGTHRLLQKDVQFKDLGLIIIDEEHRFGVANKERLKRFRAEVDVLTLTATPIPRTLHMSLSGIRELSVIETPPVNRQVTRTYLAPYEESIVREAIMRELERSGQVFYIYNRVQSIQAVAEELKGIIPEARIAVGHGQMKEGELEKVMHDFIAHETDLLVSTTIVESGLDIPNANTIIIRNADMFGLAELYQLRGRVGRSDRRAYVYLLISDPKTLGAEAKKRLHVLQSLDDLGVGFRLAIQDMEIRGAGNLLGKNQSGHIDLVGYELYSRILRDAVVQLREQQRRDAGDLTKTLEIDPEMQLGYPAHIPPAYIPDVAERLLLYQRVIELRDCDEAQDLAAELEDRFGRLPDEVQILLDVMSIRGLLRRGGAVYCAFRKESIGIKFHPDMSISGERIKNVVHEQPEVSVTASHSVSVVWQGELPERPIILYRRLERLFTDMGLLHS